MSVIVDTTKAEIEMVIKYARFGANNCMIGHTWEIEELVRCKDCKWFDITEPSGTVEPIWFRCKLKWIFVDTDDFCKRGERREE